MIARRSQGPGSLDPMFIIALVLLISSFLQGGLHPPIQNAMRDPLGFVAFLFAVGLGVTVHEFMHAYAATRMGDDTARLLGRLTLNPLAHFDIYGTLLIVLAGFGYGKPVPFNESRLRSALGVTVIALAGPLSNLVIAAIFAIPLRFGSLLPTDLLVMVVFYNCMLFVFNLLPIPPLDGSNVVYGLLSPAQRWAWRTYAQYGPMLLLLLLVFGGRIFTQIVFGPTIFIARLLAGPSF